MRPTLQKLVIIRTHNQIIEPMERPDEIKIRELGPQTARKLAKMHKPKNNNGSFKIDALKLTVYFPDDLPESQKERWEADTRAKYHQKFSNRFKNM